MITDKHKDVLEEFLNRTEEALHKNSTASDIEKTKKELESLKKKLDNLLDMHLEGKIDFGTYEQKKTELEKNIAGKQADLKILQNTSGNEKELKKRIDSMRTLLMDAPILKEFDSQVFESIVENVIIGGYDGNGNADPSMITFVYKTGFKDTKDGSGFKSERRNAKKKLSQRKENESAELSQSKSDDAR